MNDFEKVINDLKMLLDRLIRIDYYNFDNSELSGIEIIKNALDLLEEYNNDRG
ncbi:MAG: hypothetical protein IJH64_00120 [Oscillospiraceae bacterium]|nr:hypothetical protein [Oscillospiraceae bacterium]